MRPRKADGKLGQINPPFYFDSDPGPAFSCNVDPDPALHQSNANLQPLVYTLVAL